MIRFQLIAVDQYLVLLLLSKILIFVYQGKITKCIAVIYCSLCLDFRCVIISKLFVSI